jgi:predicted HicB family RNase H-like nuclease
MFAEAPVERRRPGRPRRCDKRPGPVHVRFDPSVYDALCLEAIREEMSVAAIVREAVTRLVRRRPDGISGSN